MTWRTPASAAASAGLRVDQQPVTAIWRTPRRSSWRIFWREVRDRSRGNRAGIDNCQVGLLGAGDQRMPGETELVGVLLNFGLVQTAADGIQVNLHGW